MCSLYNEGFNDAHSHRHDDHYHDCNSRHDAHGRGLRHDVRDRNSRHVHGHRLLHRHDCARNHNHRSRLRH